MDVPLFGLILLLRHDHLLTKQSDIVHKTSFTRSIWILSVSAQALLPFEAHRRYPWILNDAKHAAKYCGQLAIEIAKLSNLLVNLNYRIYKASPEMNGTRQLRILLQLVGLLIIQVCTFDGTSASFRPFSDQSLVRVELFA